MLRQRLLVAKRAPGRPPAGQNLVSRLFPGGEQLSTDLMPFQKRPHVGKTHFPYMGSQSRRDQSPQRIDRFPSFRLPHSKQGGASGIGRRNRPYFLALLFGSQAQVI